MKDIVKGAPYVSIQKTTGAPLQLSPGGIHGSIVDQIYDDKKILLVSTLDEFESLIVGVATPYIQPFSDSCPGDNIVFALDRTGPISLSTTIDKRDGLTHEVKYACIIKIFTEVRSMNPEVQIPDADKKLCEQLACDTKKQTKRQKK